MKNVARLSPTEFMKIAQAFYGQNGNPVYWVLNTSNVPEVEEFIEDYLRTNPVAPEQKQALMQALKGVEIHIMKGILKQNGERIFSSFLDGDEANRQYTVDVRGQELPYEAPAGKPTVLVSGDVATDTNMLGTCLVHELTHFVDPVESGGNYATAPSEVRSRENERRFLRDKGMPPENVENFMEQKYFGG